MDKKIHDRYKELEKEKKQIEKQIEDRIDYMIKTIYLAFGYKVKGWHFDSDREDDFPYSDGLAGFSVNAKEIKKGQGSEDFAFIDRNGDECDLNYDYPIQWLWEDFEQELLDGIKKYNDKKKAEKDAADAKILRNNKKKAELVKGAKAKLSDAEKKALGIK